MKQRLDTYEKLPSGMAEYLSNYGWHFSKKMAEWGVSMLKDINDKKVAPKDKKQIIEMLQMYNIPTEDIVGYDVVYVEGQLRSDCYGSSYEDDMHLAKGIGDRINDKDKYEGMELTRFYADCIGRGIPIYWEEMM